MVATRMSKEELALIKSAADAKGVTVSRWMRESALTAAAS
jgi:uncharacterized protein (DUF1778 family)